MMSASIGSCNVSSADCDIFQYPPVTTITNIESNLDGIFGPEHLQEILSELSSVEANRKSVIKPTYIFKVYIILGKISEGVVKSKTQLKSNQYVNVLSRYFTKNYGMLRYGKIQSTFFSNTMFATTCCQLFVSDKELIAMKPMRSQDKHGMKLP